MHRLHIERYKSQMDLDRGLYQDLIQDPVGEISCHGLQGLEVEGVVRDAVLYHHLARLQISLLGIYSLTPMLFHV